MKCFIRSITALMLAAVSTFFLEGQARAGATSEVPTAPADLRIDIRPTRQKFGSKEAVSFKVAIANVSEKDLLINAGMMLGNGAQIWDKLSLRLFDSHSREIPVQLHWRVPGIAGRIYFLGVPLRKHAEYHLAVDATDYFIGKGDAIGPGTYKIQASLKGGQSEHRANDQLPKFWEGAVISKPAAFEVVDEKR